MFKEFQKIIIDEKALVILLLASLFIKLMFLFSIDIINHDGVRYIQAAQYFADGNFLQAINAEKMPFYSLLIVGFNFIVRDWILAGRLISLFSMVFILIPFYFLTKRLFTGSVSFWACVAFVLSPTMNKLSVLVMRDPIFLFFVMSALWCFYLAITSQRKIYYILSSCLSILSILCRIEGVILFVFYLLVLLILFFKNKGEKSSLLRGALFLLGLPLLLGLTLGIGLVALYGKDVTSFSRLNEPISRLQGLLSGDFLKVYHYNYQQIAALENPFYPWTEGSFSETARHYLPFIYLLSIVDSIAKNLFPAYVLPILMVFRKKPNMNRGHLLTLLLAVIYFLVGYYFIITHDFISNRYVLIPTLMLFPWVGWGLNEVWSTINKCRLQKVAVGLFLIIFCGLPLYENYKDIIKYGKSNEIKAASQWLAKQSKFEGEIIAVTDSRIGFYASQENEKFRKTEFISLQKNFNIIEKSALESHANLLVTVVPQKERSKIHELTSYMFIKEFVGAKNSALVYRRIDH